MRSYFATTILCRLPTYYWVCVGIKNQKGWINNEEKTLIYYGHFSYWRDSKEFTFFAK